MTLDEAIRGGSVNQSKQIANQVTIDKSMINCIREHKQLIDWLKELKEIRKDRKMEIRPSVMKFAADMEQRLRDKDSKMGWGGINLGWLLNQLCKNVSELEDILIRSENGVSVEGDKEKIINTCADVANYSMMISENKKSGG